jgi:hypothetical protein
MMTKGDSVVGPLSDREKGGVMKRTRRTGASGRNELQKKPGCVTELFLLPPYLPCGPVFQNEMDT